MRDAANDLVRARADVSASSAGGAPFLIAFGATIFAAAVLTFFLPKRAAALIVMFQGTVALPLAFWLERRMSWRRMAPDNPLRALSVQTLVLQAAAFPYGLLYMSAAYRITAPVVYKRALALVRPEAA